MILKSRLYIDHTIHGIHLVFLGYSKNCEVIRDCSSSSQILVQRQPSIYRLYLDVQYPTSTTKKLSKSSVSKEMGRPSAPIKLPALGSQSLLWPYHNSVEMNHMLFSTESEVVSVQDSTTLYRYWSSIQSEHLSCNITHPHLSCQLVPRPTCCTNSCYGARSQLPSQTRRRTSRSSSSPAR